MQAHKDNEAHRRYWMGCERLVQRLVESCDVTVAEAETEGSKVICGWMCHEQDVILHYVLTRRRFQKMGVAKDLLEPFTEASGNVYYSFVPTVRGLVLPDTWKYDPYTALKWLK